MKSVELPEYIMLQPDIHGEMIDKYIHPHRFELGCFIMVHSGNAHISVNLTDYEVYTNSVVTVLPRSIIQMKARSEDFRCDLVAFSSNFVKDLTLIRSVIKQMDNIGTMPVLTLSEEEEWCLAKKYWDMMHMIFEHKSDNEMKKGAVGNLLLSFFYCICGMYSNRALQRNEISKMRRESARLTLMKPLESSPLLPSAFRSLMAIKKNLRQCGRCADSLDSTESLLRSYVHLHQPPTDMRQK